MQVATKLAVPSLCRRWDFCRSPAFPRRDSRVRTLYGVWVQFIPVTEFGPLGPKFEVHLQRFHISAYTPEHTQIEGPMGFIRRHWVPLEESQTLLGLLSILRTGTWTGAKVRLETKYKYMSWGLVSSKGSRSAA